MNIADLESTSEPKSAATQAWERAKETAAEAEQRGERYVRENPVPAILVALGGGFLLGVLAGWSIAEAQHDDYRSTCRRLARQWQHRLHFG